jgi:hypothetical protein
MLGGYCKSLPPDAIQRYWIGATHALLVPVMFPSEDRSNARKDFASDSPYA